MSDLALAEAWMTDGDTCACWGPLSSGEHQHMNCDVIVTADHPGAASNSAPGRKGPWPVVCGCECGVCKRAWWAKGRPIVREGVIVEE